MTHRVALVQCGDSKLDSLSDDDQVPAKQLYNGGYFRCKRYTAEADDLFDEWYIISAEFGLLEPGEEIGYYDTNLESLTPEERGDLYWDIMQRFKSTGLESQLEQEVVVMVSMNYLDEYEDQKGWTLRDIVQTLPGELRFPFDGSSGNGVQMGWMKDCREAGELLDPSW
jgi:hypothetical protein